MQGVGRTVSIALLWAAAACLRADAPADYAAGMQQSRAKNWPEAAQDFTRATAQDPSMAAAWKQLATSRWYLGDYDGAVASADRYLDLQPGDTGFTAWTEGLRQHQHLPARTPGFPSAGAVSPTASAISPSANAISPTAVASPLTASADNAPQGLSPAADSIVAAPPPPGAEAESVPLEAAAQINQDAQNQASSVESSAQPRSVHVGVRLMGGWALGLGSFQHGEAVASDSGGSGAAYRGSVAGGSSGALEALVDFGDHVELTLGLYPIAWNDSHSSSASGTLARSNSSDASASFLPLLVSAGWRQALGGGWTLLALAGGGTLPATTVSVSGQTVQTDASGGLTVSTLHASYAYAASPAWRAELGAEWQAPASPLSLHLGIQALGASMAGVAPTGDVESVDQDGNPAATPTDLVLPAPQALGLVDVAFLAGLCLRY